ncbi:reverse transcriptase domain-containing protein, partial [Tanacetum coccineum]
YNGKGGAIALTRWIEKMENVIDNSRCAENQKVRYATSSQVNKALTWWNTQCQARGRVAAMALSWDDFKALLVEEFCPSNEMEKLENEFWNHKMGANHAAYIDRFHKLSKLVPHLVTPESSRIKRYIAGLAPEIRGMLWATQPTTIQTAILRAGILTDEAVSCGTLIKGSDKRKGVDEPSKTGGFWRDNKKAKMGTGFVATTPARNEAGNSIPKCNKCFTRHPVNGFCRLCFNCQKSGHFVRDCWAPIRQVAPVNAVRMNNNPRVCHECGSPDHFRNTCPKLNRAPGQTGNQLAIEGSRNNRSNGNQVRGSAFNVNVNAMEAVQDPNVVAVSINVKRLRDARIVWAAARVARQGVSYDLVILHGERQCYLSRRSGSLLSAGLLTRRFIANFSKIAKPLTSLTQKNQKYVWGVEQEEAFQTLKNNLCDAPILTLPMELKIS